MGLETPETERVDIPQPEPLQVPSAEPSREPVPSKRTSWFCVATWSGPAAAMGLSRPRRKRREKTA